MSSVNRGVAPLAMQGFSEVLQIARETQGTLHETIGEGEIFVVRCGVSLIPPTPVVEFPDAPLIPDMSLVCFWNA